MEIHHALQEPQNATIDILAVVAAMDAYTVLSKWDLGGHIDGW
jgi:hypothetical protein